MKDSRMFFLVQVELLDDDEDGRMGRHSSPPFVYLAASYLRYCLQTARLLASEAISGTVCDSGHKVFDDVGGRGQWQVGHSLVTTLMEDSEPSSCGCRPL
ncbi:hypothetical protein LZ32DRAFT_222424 [Colletotrichum eremochloae]|nr:hypothetical protein LZ32DRAFT_222424 [Colletotrichum eremochloae]